MTEQLNFFSAADEYLERCETALVALDFSGAQKALRMAWDINPESGNLKSLFEIIEYIKDFPFKGRALVDVLADIWQSLPTAVDADQLTIHQARLADGYVLRMITANCAMQQPFLDATETVHWGALLNAQRHYRQAKEKLYDSLMNSHQSRGDLWFAYGESCYMLAEYAKAEVAFIHGLALTPQSVDIFRTRWEKITDYLSKLTRLYGRQQARGILLFQLWLSEEISLIKMPASYLAEYHRIEKDGIRCFDGEQAVRLHHFCLCFLLAEQSTGEEEFYWREKMKQYDPDWYEKYMRKRR
jgi:tetratricopeptide (TPR) repeat protein